MAKKSARVLFGLVCSLCSNQNYVSEKNKLNTQDALSFNKFCDKCKKYTMHKEKKKLD